MTGWKQLFLAGTFMLGTASSIATDDAATASDINLRLNKHSQLRSSASHMTSSESARTLQASNQATFNKTCNYLDRYLGSSYKCECLSSASQENGDVATPFIITPNQSNDVDIVRCQLRADVLYYLYDSITGEPLEEFDCHCPSGSCEQGDSCFGISFVEENESTPSTPCKMMEFSTPQADGSLTLVQQGCYTCEVCGTWGSEYYRVLYRDATNVDAASCSAITAGPDPRKGRCLSTKLLSQYRLLPPPPPVPPVIPSEFQQSCQNLKQHYESAFEETRCLCEGNGGPQLAPGFPSNTYITASCVVPQSSLTVTQEPEYFLHNLVWFFSRATGEIQYAVHFYCTDLLCGQNDLDHSVTIHFQGMPQQPQQSNNDGPTCLFQIPKSFASCPSHSRGGQCTVLPNPNQYFQVNVENCAAGEAILGPTTTSVRDTLILFPATL